jgi:hypothetical protein
MDVIIRPCDSWNWHNSIMQSTKPLFNAFFVLGSTKADMLYTYGRYILPYVDIGVIPVTTMCSFIVSFLSSSLSPTRPLGCCSSFFRWSPGHRDAGKTQKKFKVENLASAPPEGDPTRSARKPQKLPLSYGELVGRRYFFRLHIILS